MTYRNLTLSGLGKLAGSMVAPSQAQKKARVFGLVGPLGAGKTTFTQAMAKALGIDNAKSPTFTIVHCYNGPKKSLYHVDLYRLEKDRELDALGLDEILTDSDNLMAIEWADKFPQILKRCDTIITFEITKDKKRNVTVKNNS
jgi:tRNA threonylcarbamoyladenosine biosynthesis protein TsaE